MGEHKGAEVRPNDVALVLGSAFGQLLDLWQAALKALLETADAEDDIPGESSDTFLAQMIGGKPPNLTAHLKGETFGESLKANSVHFESGMPDTGGMVLMTAMVDEQLANPVTGDIYRGDVCYTGGKPITEIVLDAGS